MMGAANPNFYRQPVNGPSQACLPFSDPNKTPKSKTLKTKPPSRKITEIILPLQAKNSHDLVLPMLSHLNRNSDGRWLTLILLTPISKALLTEYNFDLNQLRILTAKDEIDASHLFKAAINCNTSNTVVACFEATPLSVNELLDYQPQKNDVRGLVFHYQ